MSKQPKRPRDANQLAKFIVDAATGEIELPDGPGHGKDPAAVALGRLGGLKGGAARAAKLTKGHRQAIAKRAAAVRWNAGNAAQSLERDSSATDDMLKHFDDKLRHLEEQITFWKEGRARYLAGELTTGGPLHLPTKKPSC